MPLALLLLVGAELGTPLRQDGYRFQPPAGFRMARLEPYAGTRVGAVSASGTAPRFLSAALVDGAGPDAAVLLVAVVDGPFEAEPGAPDDFAAAVARHFREELGLEFALDRVERVAGPAPRIEVRGTLRQDGQQRAVLVAGMEEAGARHAVVTFSVPSARLAALEPALRASLDSFRPEADPRLDERGPAYVIAGAVLVALALSLHLRRKRAPREPEPP